MSSAIDLHMHTTYSDGEDPPEAVLRRCAALGLKTVALTDHDNTNGVRAARSLAHELDLRLIPGIEATCRWDACHTRPGEGDIDVLGYFVDVDDADFQAFELAALADIYERIAECCDRLTAGGYPVTLEEVFARNPDYAGLQHLIHLIQHKGYAPEWQDAWALMMRGWVQVRLSCFTIDRVIDRIHRAGGVAVLAHPTMVRCDDRWLQDAQMAALVEMGLDGLELYHYRLDAAARAHFGALARRFGLLVSGGSDAHGWFDNWRRLGTEPVTGEMVAALEARHIAWRNRQVL